MLKLIDVKPGDMLIPDGGFDCLREGVPVEVKADKNGELYVCCDDGSHHLEGQLDWDGNGTLVGLAPA